MKIYYNSKLKEMARKLRKQGILSEALLWNYLKGKKIRGHQFTRQKPIGEYIVDFYCSKLKLVIEIDGSSHNGKFDYDLKRQNFLESLGLTVLRFNDTDVKRDIYNVLMAIEGWILQNNPMPPLLKHNPLAPFTKGELIVTVPREKYK